jgi:MFS family permease
MIQPHATMPGRMPFFYGWVVVLGAALNGSFVLGSAQFALGAFLVPMEEDLGWSNSVLFGALGVRQLVGGLLGPVIGPLVDGPTAPRIVMPLGGLLLGLSLMSVYWVHSPLWFFLTYGLLGALAFALINTTMWDAVVLKWFVRKRARALVWTSFGAASASMIFPLLVTFLILTVGWREAWLWYGILTIVVLVPVGLLVRARPEREGLVPDGEAPSASEAEHAQRAPSPVSVTRAEAMHTPAFWLIGGAFALTAFGINAFQAHWIPYFIEIGFSAGVAAAAVSVYGASNVASRVLWGWLATRYSIRALLLTHTLMAGVGVGFALMIQNAPMLFAWAIWHGIFLGSYNYLHTLLSAEYFGRMHIGAIRGAWLMPASVMRASGPLILGVLHNVRGSYVLPFLFAWGIWGVVTAALATARRPSPKPSPESASGEASPPTSP